MPKVSKPKVPDALRPYFFHGVEIEVPSSGKEAMGDCPFCGKTGKFSVNVETSMFKCWSSSCAVQGNSTVFLRLFWEHCKENTTTADYKKLAELSKFTFPDAARSFGVVMSTLTSQWLVPGYGPEGKLTGLYRYGRILDGGKWKDRLLVCPGTGVHLFNLPNLDDSKPIINLCEGWRDGIKLFEAMTNTTIGGQPLITKHSVLAIPGTNSFKSQWCKFFAGKQVNIWFDNDKPSDEGKDGAGLFGVKKVASVLRSSTTPPEEIRYLAWNGNPEQYDENVPNGMDVRDYLTV